MAKVLGDNLSVQKGVPPASRGAAAVAALAVSTEKPAEAKRTRIVIEENEDLTPAGAFIQINGRSYMIRPGEEVDVLPEVIETLNNAVIMVPVRDSSQRVVGHRRKMRFPYRVIPVLDRPVAA